MLVIKYASLRAAGTSSNSGSSVDSNLQMSSMSQADSILRFLLYRLFVTVEYSDISIVGPTVPQAFLVHLLKAFYSSEPNALIKELLLLSTLDVIKRLVPSSALKATTSHTVYALLCDYQTRFPHLLPTPPPRPQHRVTNGTSKHTTSSSTSNSSVSGSVSQHVDNNMKSGGNASTSRNSDNGNERTRDIITSNNTTGIQLTYTAILRELPDSSFERRGMKATEVLDDLLVVLNRHGDVYYKYGMVGTWMWTTNDSRRESRASQHIGISSKLDQHQANMSSSSYHSNNSATNTTTASMKTSDTSSHVSDLKQTTINSSNSKEIQTTHSIVPSVDSTNTQWVIDEFALAHQSALSPSATQKLVDALRVHRDLFVTRAADYLSMVRTVLYIHNVALYIHNISSYE